MHVVFVFELCLVTMLESDGREDLAGALAETDVQFGFRVKGVSENLDLVAVEKEAARLSCGASFG
jgi:hypothetical protein